MSTLRPCLKRANSSSCSSVKSSVSFSTNISTTYLTHAPSQYNRSPIQVDLAQLNQCSLPHREPELIDGYGSVLVRDDEDSDEYYDSLTPLPPSCQTASVYVPSPSAYMSYRQPPPSPSSNSSRHPYTQSTNPFMPGFGPSPKRKLSDASDNSEKSISWSCLDGF
ncbi:hypothetical protein M407DRAFT_241501 [Tulasnella calospora MUT 4182]|uniref:Uncharacterized protein n=1 Tax=Tulasnella calospora MUT 4182 TaxID=1051891 RepID=A0A0C3QUQ1_9AGAM|nr:hypothetical protein M407DRAFT_241501 [Tulasnella calospora MUT 4182]